MGRPPMHPDAHAHRLPRWQRVTLYAVGAVLVATGVVWLVVHYAFGEGAGGLPHPLEAWCMRLHGLAAFGGLFIVGALSTSHIPRGWKLTLRRGWAKQRSSGLWLCALAALLIVSGYLLYYFAPEGIRPALGWIHTAFGLSMALLIASHRRAAPFANAP